MNAPNIYPNGPVFVPPLDYGTVAGRDLYLPLPAETGNRTAVRQAPADLPRTGHARIPPALGTPPLPLHLRFPLLGLCARPSRRPGHRPPAPAVPQGLSRSICALPTSS